MMRLNDLSSLLGEGWGDLVTFIVIAAFYLVGALAKAWANREKASQKEQKSKLRQMVEEAKRSIVMEQTKKGQSSSQLAPYAKVITDKQLDRQKRVSDWDHRQALKRLQRQQPAIKPVPQQKPPSRTIPKRHVTSAMGQGTLRPEQAARQIIVQPVPVGQPPVRLPIPAATTPVSQLTKSPEKIELLLPHIDDKSKTSQASYFGRILRTPESLQRAIILKEILDLPLAIRERN